jgi:amino acid adenylation domain-containing protein
MAKSISCLNCREASHNVDWLYNFGLKAGDMNTHLFDLLTSVFENTPFQEAIVFRGETLTYHQLEVRLTEVANFLLSNGLQNGDVVGILLPRTAELVPLMLGILKAGGTYLPMDINLPESRISFMLADSDCKFLFTLRDQIVGFKGRGFSAPVFGVAERLPFPRLHQNHPAYMIYTSGTSGVPKGVRVSHGNLANFLSGMMEIFKLSASDRVLAHTTISFDISGLEIFLPLVSGSAIYLLDDAEARDARAFLQKAKREGVTFIQATPAMWKAMLLAGWHDRLPVTALSGGEALPADLARELLPRVGALWNMYGPTETTIWSTCKQIVGEESPVSVGRPIRETRVYILDERLDPVEQGRRGEIFIAGSGVSLGYHNCPELDSERFVPEPGYPGQRMYRTGDLGYLDESGLLYCLGRSDFQIKVNGYRIEVEEIEIRIRALTGITDAVVSTQTGKRGNPVLIAFVMLSGECSSDLTTAWNTILAQDLPSYMIPSRYIPVNEFPLNANGKTDRKALDELHGKR